MVHSALHNEQPAAHSVRQIKDGLLTSVALVTACLTRIEDTDPQLKAWAHLDAEGALEQAQALDAIRQAGKPLGPLHGIPVGLKDIIDTSGLPTERGTSIFAGRQPDADAAVVERLREAGAVILGKTVTTELAFMHPSPTRNPHNPAHSPGGSSSGSAAAVAALQVPLAIGTQTNGSVIRPASYCGVFGFKPTRGMISRRGILKTSGSLDQVGVFARELEDVALLADALASYDPADPLSPPRPRPRMHEGFQSDVPIEPMLAWFELPYADRLSDETLAGLGEVTDLLGARVERLTAPPRFATLIETQRTIHEYEFCQALDQTITDNWDALSGELQGVVTHGRTIGRSAYQDALGELADAEDLFAVFFRDFDAIIAPSAVGVAPLFNDGTGDPICSTVWTVGGLPCVSLPLLVGESGLPIGVQLIAGKEEDDRLLRTAKWVVAALQDEPA